MANGSVKRTCPACLKHDRRRVLVDLVEPSTEIRNGRRYVWVVEIEVDAIWVADGFDIDDEEAESMIRHRLSWAHGSELGAKVLRRPDPKQVRAEQGYKEVGYAPIHDD